MVHIPSSEPHRSDDSELALVRELGMLFNRARQRFASHFRDALESRGENWMRWHLLAHICQDGPCSQRELAQQMGLDPSGISRLLDEVEEAGLVRRQRDSEDRRKVMVEALALGRETFEKHVETVLSVLQRLLAPLDRKERETLVALYRKLTDAHGESPAPEPRAPSRPAPPAPPAAHRRRRNRRRAQP